MEQKPIATIAEFHEVDTLIAAAQAVREHGYTKFDCYTPYPVHGLDRAMGIKRTILPYISFVGGITGLTTALLLQWWTGAVDYRLNIGGKPFFALQFSIPVDFELTVLICAFFTLFGLLHLCRLPTWWHPLQDDPSFRRATDDTYVVAIFADDPRYTTSATKELLQSVGGTNVHVHYAADTQSVTVPVSETVRP
ncbi:MAG: DUF3341 domain-containing protein [Bacteroidota bacterium]|nr:DUF3341 domain-containing protein [Candidatus Kapabacteria bacterium]MCS7302143.1 DUF3341 domain-containing protein [Candidatus Kapabacteria bacterium]MCX7936428.1 DUF3341 domain-containing protein [Chlorobiota bacterium]MDW8074292.1 DUF3341 domain-containing protein [Bacteroidota bacterium]MDW8271232.1 DUF3341 domain-containing protein [Bacteroidota bacterium]